MFVSYRLFHRCIHPTPPSTSSPTSPESSSDPQSGRAIIIWFIVFGFSLLFRPAVELVIRILFFSACALLLGTLDGSLNLLVGHAVLRATGYGGYEPHLLSSIEAGSLGGIITIGPTIIITVSLIALFGGSKLQRVLSARLMVLLELAFMIAASAAACTLGATVIRRTYPDDDLPLDATHAARAGALGACILTVPIVSIAAYLMPQLMPPMRSELDMPPSQLAVTCDLEHLGVSDSGEDPRTWQLRRHFTARTAAETVGYVLVTLCILTIRLLCF